MPDTIVSENWSEYRRLVIEKLESLEHKDTSTEEKLDELKDLINQVSEKAKDSLHKVDLRVNTLETKIYIMSAAITTVVSIIVAVGKAIIAYYS